MYNSLETLSGKCKKYHLKKFLKKAFFIIIFLILLFSAYKLFTYFMQKGPKPLDEKKVENIKALKDNKPKVEKKALQTDPTNKDIKYDLSMDDYTYTTTSTSKNSHKYIKKDSSENVKKSFSISTRSIDSIQNLLDAYKNHKTYALAIKISKYYYQNQNYDKSLSWSRKANKLDKKDDQSWIMYAKSEYALGNKHTAKNMLSLYLKSTSSKEAEKLLQNWLKGD